MAGGHGHAEGPKSGFGAYFNNVTTAGRRNGETSDGILGHEQIT